MEYFKLLNLSKEPFSNSPNPEFFYQSPQHVACLQKLELSIRLRRGLSVVIGDVGTGKSTLCRQLIRKCTADRVVEAHLILDPHFVTPLEFLSALAAMFGLGGVGESENSTWQIKENIKKFLFDKGVREKKTVVLVIDEGQKLPKFCLEILRELLNFETNEHKLLQIVIFAQREFHQTITEHPNFADRINFFHILKPLTYAETRDMLRFRLEQAKNSYKAPELFTKSGIFAVYRATGGYPRKIIHLCHRVLVTLIIQNRSKADWSLVRWCSRMLFPGEAFPMPWAVTAVMACFLIIVAIVGFTPGKLKVPFLDEVGKLKNALRQQEDANSFVPKRYKIPLPLDAAEREQGMSRKEAVYSEMKVRGRIIAPTSQVSGTSITSSVVSDTPSDELTELAATRPQPDPAEPNTGVSQESPPAGSYVPDTLGQITLKPGDNLEQMIRKVYGTYDQQYLKAVMQSNPHIRGANDLDAGRSITFPTLPIKCGSIPQNGSLVQVAEKNTLEDAYRLIRSYPHNAPAIFLLPYWNTQDGLKFSLLLKDCCVDKQSAEYALREIPPSFGSSAKIITRWDDNFIFFAR